eukprot:EG_transcript_4496
MLYYTYALEVQAPRRSFPAFQMGLNALLGLGLMLALGAWLYEPRLPYLTHATIIGLPPIPTTAQAEEYVTFSILQMNDVYEALPISNGTRGGLARVATLRRWLQEQNRDVITVMAGDLISPCALDAAAASKNLRFDGKHMVSIMNALGLDYMIFGNHEFDVSKRVLQQRIAESRFQWISSNVVDSVTGRPFPNVTTYVLRNIRGCRVLFVALTVDENRGENDYVRITPTAELPEFLQRFIAPFEGHYDVLVALTHISVADDVAITEAVPQVDLIVGGHDHEGWHIWRGPRNTHITKADSNVGSVFIHRLAFGLQSRKLTIQHRHVPVTDEIPEEPAVARLAREWYQRSFDHFRTMGLHPEKVVITLPGDLELDGRDKVLRRGPSPLTAMVCEAEVEQAAAFHPTMGFINAGIVRIDDRLFGAITEYDVIRMFPFPNVIVVLRVKGRILATTFDWGQSLQGNGMFSFPCGAGLDAEGRWVTADGAVLNGSEELFLIATNSYLLEAPGSPLAGSPDVTRLGDIGLFSTNFVAYLQRKFRAAPAA